MENVRKHLLLLGMKVEDKVTGAKGVVDSISFDLYGCVQAGINPGLDKDGVQAQCTWFDVSRIIIRSKAPVMEPPNFSHGLAAEGKSGAANKAPMHKN